MGHRSEEVSAFLRRSLRLHRLFSLFRDIRRDPVIPLKNLLGMIFCMPFFGQTTMLGADREARKKRQRLLFDAEHRTRPYENGRFRHDAATRAAVA